MNEIKEIKFKRSFIHVKEHIDNLYHNGTDRVRIYYGIDYHSQILEEIDIQQVIIYDNFKLHFKNFTDEELKVLISRYFEYKYNIIIEND